LYLEYHIFCIFEMFIKGGGNGVFDRLSLLKYSR
jgi:hypothetical protein